MEQSKLAIEETYSRKAQDIEESGIAASYTKQLDTYRVLAGAQLISYQEYTQDRQALERNYQSDITKLSEKTDADIAASRENAAIQSFASIRAESDKINSLIVQQTQEAQFLRRPI